jgi:hypothetical protein
MNRVNTEKEWKCRRYKKLSIAAFLSLFVRCNSKSDSTLFSPPPPPFSCTGSVRRRGGKGNPSKTPKELLEKDDSLQKKKKKKKKKNTKVELEAVRENLLQKSLSRS